jgi:BlaI family penicillinase repressor
VAPLVAHFSQTRKLTKKDLADLKKLIRELDPEDGLPEADNER